VHKTSFYIPSRLCKINGSSRTPVIAQGIELRAKETIIKRKVESDSAYVLAHNGHAYCTVWSARKLCRFTTKFSMRSYLSTLDYCDANLVLHRKNFTHRDELPRQDRVIILI
jgi:hypothetical protein